MTEKLRVGIRHGIGILKQKKVITYQEKLYEKNNFNLEFVTNFERNFNYFKETLKKIKEFSEILGCKEWTVYFNNVFELEKIENAKEFIPTKALYKVIPDRNLCAYAMAIQAYPFGGMGSWCDNAYEIAREKNWIMNTKGFLKIYF